MNNAQALIQIWDGDTSITNFAEECGVDLDAPFQCGPAHDNAYRERAQLLALLAAFLGPGVAHIGDTDPEAEGWPVLTLELPTGQASWHIAPGDVELFGHVRATAQGDRTWDGHSTDAKYGRVAHLARALGAGHDAVMGVLSEQALDCGRCVTEDGVEVHPHPECPVRTPCQTCPRADNINGPCPCETED